MEVGVFLTEPRRYRKPSLLGFNFYVCHFAVGKIQLCILGGGQCYLTLLFNQGPINQSIKTVNTF